MTTDAEGYNYARFDDYVTTGAEAQEFGAFPGHLSAGDPAPDGTLTRLDDGAEIALSELWRRRPLIAEFGSFT